MEKQATETVIQYVAYGAVIVITFFRAFSASYQYVKDLFSKSKKDDKSSVTVNVGTPSEHEILLNDKDKYLILVLLEHSKLLKDIHDLKPDVLKEQMDYYDKFSRRIKNELFDIMMELLKDVGIDDIHFGTYFSNFENFIEMSEEQVRDEYESMCIRNHFSKCTSVSFKELIYNNISILEAKINELLRKRYPQKEVIKNFDRVYRLKSDIRLGFKDCFRKAKEISEEKENAVKLAKENFENKIYKLTGEEYNAGDINV